MKDDRPSRQVKKLYKVVNGVKRKKVSTTHSSNKL